MYVCIWSWKRIIAVEFVFRYQITINIFFILTTHLKTSIKPENFHDKNIIQLPSILERSLPIYHSLPQPIPRIPNLLPNKFEIIAMARFSVVLSIAVVAVVAIYTHQVVSTKHRHNYYIFEMWWFQLIIHYIHKW